MSGWRRFERGSRTGAEDQFWAVRVSGPVVEIRRGFTDPDQVIEERREYARAAAARSAAQQKIRSRLGRGWVEVEVEVGEDERLPANTEAAALGEALELELAAAPDDSERWAVYGDFLQQIEPLLGERVALGLALEQAESTCERERLQAMIDTFEQDHARALLGVTLAGMTEGWRYEDSLSLERRFGMIVGVRLEDVGGDIFKFDAVARALLELPLARVLIDLELAAHVETAPFMRTLALLLRRRHPTIRRLTLGRPSYSQRTYAFRHPPIQALLDAFPNLDSLALFGPFYGAASHSRLTELRLGRPARGSKFRLRSWQLPSLRCLALDRPDVIEWPKTGFPALRRLRLRNLLEPSRALISCIARMPNIARLDELVLDDVDVTHDIAHAIVENAKLLAGPRRITLSPIDELEYGVNLNALSERLPNLEIRPA